MTNYLHFQTQITTIMEIMTKTTIAEMTKLFNDSSSVLCLKVSRTLHENEALKKKLQLLQHELTTARGQKEQIKSAPESHVNTRSVGVQVLLEEPCGETGQGRSFSLRRDEERPGVEQCVNMEKVWTEPVLIKQERLEEGLCYRDPQATPGGEGEVTQPTPATEEQITQPTALRNGKKPDTEPIPEGDQEELSEQHRCEHGDEELSGLEFVVKAEQEEEHIGQTLNQIGCKHIAGRLNNLGSEHVMYDRDSQLWTSFTQGDSDLETGDPICCTEQCSPNLSINRQLQHTPAAMEVSGNALHSFGASYVLEFDKMSEKPSACCEELISEAIHTQQGQYREKLHTVERENQTLLPLQQQEEHGPSAKHMTGSESPAQPHSGSQYETGSTLSTSAFNAGKKRKTDGQSDFGKKPFICIYCGKSFNCFSHLTSHHRIHTGEKPYSCSQCGKSFSLKGNLVKHERVHSGYKPFGCTQCGKRFTRAANLRAHHRTHTREMPYHWEEFHSPNLAHQRIQRSETIQL